MPIMKDFRSMSFIDQIKILTDIQAEKNAEAMPALLELFREPLNDTMVDHLVTTALNAILSVNETELLKLLKEGNLLEKALCVGIAGNRRCMGAVPLLHDMIEKECHDGLLTDILQSLSKIKAPESIGLFRRYIFHDDAMLSAIAIETAGQYRDVQAIEDLCSIINKSGDDDQYEVCSLQADMAVQALAMIPNDSTIAFLVSKIHHRNATLRRQIQDSLIRIGAEAIPYIATVFDSNDIDSKILAANILGFIKDRKGGDVLVKALDSGKADHPNIRYAIYEAFGRISSLKGITCLIDALNNGDDFILMAVITALNEHVNPGVTLQIKKVLDANSDQSRKIIKAIAASKAESIFKSLYEDEKSSSSIIGSICELGDSHTKKFFSDILTGIPGDRAQKDLERLSSAGKSNLGMIAVLAVDDSKAMLNYYKTIGPDLGCSITVAINGKEAIDLVDSGSVFDLVITDMNMPVMDGVEFTKKLREKIGWGTTPVIMVTTESEESQKELARKAGVNTFLTKPFTTEKLKEAINNFSVSQSN